MINFSFDPGDWAQSVPAAPKEITLYQAAGLIPVLVDDHTKRALSARLRIHDPVIRVWALTKLLADGVVSLDVLAMCMHVAPRSAYLRRLLLPATLQAFRFDLSRKIIQLDAEKSKDVASLTTRYLDHVYKNNFEGQLASLELLYLQTGQESYINDATELARSRLGWKAAWKPYLRQLFTRTRPTVQTAVALIRMLEREDARNEVKAISPLFAKVDSCKLAYAYSVAQLYYWNKEYSRCLQYIERTNLLNATQNKVSFLFNLQANALEKQGEFKEAAKSYQAQNAAVRKENLKPERFIADLEGRAKLPIGELPLDDKTNFMVMTGFPRSGTTLLENALACHPHVSTCEETSSLLGSLNTAYSTPMSQDPDRKRLNMRAALHRSLYYANMRRYVTKADAKVIIDKTPIIGANIKYMEKIFPNKRYIFSIRHPYDVVLSNYKQDYQQNIAMTAFNDMHSACVLYDYVMRNWFEVFPGETDRVFYVKYDDLVNDFEPQVRNVLAFIGVEWTDEIMNFATNAAKRAVRTPSYTNVRKGLTIGVQTSWQNFEFLFDEKCRALLDPWVRRFGYSD
jgi:tetratricopeptide (TPR) repeat protein